MEDDNSINHYIFEPSGYPYNLDEDYNKSSLDEDYNEREKDKKKAVVVVAKGCVAKCTFCHRYEKGNRVSPLDSLVNHMKMLKEKYNVKYINRTNNKTNK